LSDFGKIYHFISFATGREELCRQAKHLECIEGCGEGLEGLDEGLELPL